MNFIIIGSIAFDDIKTPAGEVVNSLGGSAVYAAIAASKYAKNGIVGVVGDDFDPAIIDLLKKQHIDTTGIEYAKGKTFRWKGVYNDLNKAETLDTQLNVFADFDPKIPEAYQNAEYLFLGNIHPALQLKVIEKMPQAKLIACDTMNYWIDTCPDLLMEVVKKVNILFINEDEIKSFTNEHNVFTAGEKILSYGPQLVLIKRGEYGSVALAKDFMFFAPVYPVKNVCDPTGAGDSFAGGFMGTLVENNLLTPELIKEAVLNGTITASFNIESFSSDKLLNSNRQNIIDRINTLKNYMKI